MSFKVKLVIAGINIGLLAATLLIPTNSTPISLIPIVVSLCGWIFTSKKDSIWAYIILSLAILVGVFCSLVGMFAKEITATGIIFKEGLTLSNQHWKYEWFAWPVFFFVTLFIVAELINTYKSTKSDSKSTGCICELIESKIKK